MAKESKPSTPGAARAHFLKSTASFKPSQLVTVQVDQLRLACDEVTPINPTNPTDPAYLSDPAGIVENNDAAVTPLKKTRKQNPKK